MPADAPVLERLRAMPPELRTRALSQLAQRGLLATVEAPPVRREPAGDELTHKQRALWELDHDGRHGDFYHCAALWFAPSVPAAALADAYTATAGHFEALSRGLDTAGGPPRVRRVSTPVPTTTTVPAGDDPQGWLRAAVAAAAGEPIDPAAEPARVHVYTMPDGSGALAVLGHDLHLDEQGLVQVLGRAVAAQLAGTEPVVEQLRISDVAAWQQQRLDDGVLGLAVDARREALRGVPRCPWPTDGDRTGRRIEIASGTGAWQSLRDTAAGSEVSAASAALAAWYRALHTWDARAGATPIGCCTTARMRPELQTTLGNLTNTVVVVPAAAWVRLDAPQLRDETHQALTEALGAADVPFELVFADRPVQDEEVGIRFTFAEDPPAAPDAPLYAQAVDFGYAKSVLSCELHVTDERLHAWLDYRPAQIDPAAAEQLAALLRSELALG